MLRPLQALFKSFDKARFPDASLSRQKDRLALPRLRQLPPFEQKADLTNAADKFRKSAGMRGFETAIHRSLTSDFEHRNG
ncbi:hypothetical protein LZK75_33180 (plasmid) [Rhizobium leguminosarum]|nr:hypothetical protein LZK75_33180 [Rhizobium leguminosarum]